MAAPERSMWARLVRKGQRPALLGFRSSTTLIMFMICFAVFADLFPYAVIVPVMPFALTSRAGVPQDKVQFWISISLAAFGAAILVSAPIWGILADRTRDRRTPMLAGLILLVAATFLLCFMQSIPMLVVGRIFQGLTSALTWSVGMALVTDTVSTERTGQAMGWVGIAVTLGTLTSPLLGGVVYGKGGYYEVWAMCFAIVAGDIILRLVVIEKKYAAEWLQPTETQETQATGTSLGLDEGRGTTSARTESRKQIREKRTSPNSVAPAADHLQSVNESVDAESATSDPDHLSFKSVMKLLTSTRLLAALWATVVEAAILTAFDSTLPLQVEKTFGWDSIGAGLIFLPLVAPTFAGPLVGKACDRYGPRWLLAFGFMFEVPFLICLRFVEENSMSHKVMLCGLLAGTGCGLVFCFGPATAEISWAVEAGFEGNGKKPVALAYGFYNVAFSAGSLIGPILGGFIRDHQGWPSVGWSLAIISFVTSIVCALWVGGPPLWKKTGKPVERPNETALSPVAEE